MRGAPNRDKGWWIQQGNWSFSWSVAHSLRWYLEGSTTGLKGRRVQYAEELELGDVIFMIFKGMEELTTLLLLQVFKMVFHM